MRGGINQSECLDAIVSYIESRRLNPTTKVGIRSKRLSLINLVDTITRVAMKPKEKAAAFRASMGSMLDRGIIPKMILIPNKRFKATFAYITPFTILFTVS
jgi:hypothetical protein